MQSRKEKFLTRPNEDPKTGEIILINSKKYKDLDESKFVRAIALEKKYGTPKIKSPKTDNKISVGKGEYKKLIKE